MNIDYKYSERTLSLLGDIKMKVKWEVEDGYVGKSCPHFTDVPDDELEECETEEEKGDLIDSYIKEDFEQKITYHWDYSIVERC